MPERLLKQFKKLDQTGPSAEWQEGVRDFLVKRVSQNTITKKASWQSSLEIFSIVWVRKLLPSPVKMITALIILTLVGGTGLMAQASYIPSGAFYTAKRFGENVQLVFAITPQSETKINLKFAEERKKEAVKLAKKEDIKPEEKKEYINTVVKSLKQNISAAQTSLDIVKEREKENQNSDTIKLTKELTENVSQNIDDLEEVKAIVSIKEVKAVVTQVQNELEKVEDDSLKDLIKEVEKKEKQDNSEVKVELVQAEATSTESELLPEENIDGYQAEVAVEASGNETTEAFADPSADQVKKTKEGVTETVTREEVQQILAKKITRANKKIQEVGKIAEAFDLVETIKDADEEIADYDVVKEVSNVVDNPAQVQEALTQAITLFDNGNLAKALDKVIEIKEITTKSEAIISRIEEIKESQEAVDKNKDNKQLQVSTSTPEVLLESQTGKVKGVVEVVDVDLKKESSTSTSETTPKIIPLKESVKKKVQEPVKAENLK